MRIGCRTEVVWASDWTVDCIRYQVSDIRYSGIRKRRGKGEGRDSMSCGNKVDGIEIVGIMIMPSIRHALKKRASRN